MANGGGGLGSLAPAGRGRLSTILSRPSVLSWVCDNQSLNGEGGILAANVDGVPPTR